MKQFFYSTLAFSPATAGFKGIVKLDIRNLNFKPDEIVIKKVSGCAKIDVSEVGTVGIILPQIRPDILGSFVSGELLNDTYLNTRITDLPSIGGEYLDVHLYFFPTTELWDGVNLGENEYFDITIDFEFSRNI